jgi:hypothetical protein
VITTLDCVDHTFIADDRARCSQVKTMISVFGSNPCTAAPDDHPRVGSASSPCPGRGGEIGLNVPV